MPRLSIEQKITQQHSTCIDKLRIFATIKDAGAESSLELFAHGSMKRRILMDINIKVKDKIAVGDETLTVSYTHLTLPTSITV